MTAPRVTVQTPRPSVVAIASPTPPAAPKAPASTVNTPRPSVTGAGS